MWDYDLNNRNGVNLGLIIAAVEFVLIFVTLLIKERGRERF